MGGCAHTKLARRGFDVKEARCSQGRVGGLWLDGAMLVEAIGGAWRVFGGRSALD